MIRIIRGSSSELVVDQVGRYFIYFIYLSDATHGTTGKQLVMSLLFDPRQRCWQTTAGFTLVDAPEDWAEWFTRNQAEEESGTGWVSNGNPNDEYWRVLHEVTKNNLGNRSLPRGRLLDSGVCADE